MIGVDKLLCVSVIQVCWERRGRSCYCCCCCYNGLLWMKFKEVLPAGKEVCMCLRKSVIHDVKCENSRVSVEVGVNGKVSLRLPVHEPCFVLAFLCNCVTRKTWLRTLVVFRGVKRRFAARPTGSHVSGILVRGCPRDYYILRILHIPCSCHNNTFLARQCRALAGHLNWPTHMRHKWSRKESSLDIERPAWKIHHV